MPCGPESARSGRDFGIRTERCNTAAWFSVWAEWPGTRFTGVPQGHAGYFNRAYLQQNCSAVTGACLLVRKEVFEEAGGFDETNLAISFNDVDFCLRLRAAGLQNVWTPYANLIHHESASRGHQRTREEQAQFVREATFMQENGESNCCTIPSTTLICRSICRASNSPFRHGCPSSRNVGGKGSRSLRKRLNWSARPGNGLK